MDFLVVTGMSGAGKSLAVDVLEDIGYYCVDNMPPALISKFSEVCAQSGGKINKVAMVVDVRGGELFSGLLESIAELRSRAEHCQMLYLDCGDSAIITRYKETRRKHPLCENGGRSIEEAIHRERELLSPARKSADYIIDTTLLTAAQLRDKVCTIFEGGGGSRMLINCMSFGFKYGLPSEADLVFDVRCLPNPFYLPALKELTGLDAPVENYVMNTVQAVGLLEKLSDLLEYLVPLYLAEGKSQLMIAIGCTGGRHRSVVFAEKLGAFLAQRDYRVVRSHRDIRKVRS